MVTQARNHAVAASSMYTSKRSEDKPTSEQNGRRLYDNLPDQVSLESGVRKLIATLPFLRLERIQQLGFVNRIWPEATHTRYEHSLGCYYRACQAIHVLRQSYLFSEQAIKTFLLASLLHDIGHYGFAHYIEEIGKPTLPHERVGRRIIEQSEIAMILERDYQVSPQRVADLIDPPRHRVLPSDDALLSLLLSGTIDVDKFDYVPRDAQACHMPSSEGDVTRLIASLRIHSQVLGEPGVVLAQEAIGTLPSFLHSRQAMHLAVYRHPLNRICHAMLRRAIQDALVSGTVSAEQLTKMDDDALLAVLSHHPDHPLSTHVLGQALENQRHYHILLEMSQHVPIFSTLATLVSDAWQCRKAEQFLAIDLTSVLGQQIEDYELLVDFPHAKQWDMDGWFLFSSPPLGLPSLASWSTVLGLFPEDLRRYEDAHRYIRILASERVQTLLAANSREVLLPCLERLLLSLCPMGDNKGSMRN
jgi:HD superfamily phosphohydrolase